MRLGHVLAVWVALAGSAGAGKTSLSRAVGAALQGAGKVVDVCGEDELFTRPEFAVAARQFQGAGLPTPEDLETAYATWVAALPRRSWAVTDWHPAGMAGDLPWAIGDPLLLRRHLEVVRRLAAHALVVDLRVPAAIATERAAAERGEEWLRRSDRVASAAGHDEPDRLGRVHAWTEAHTVRTAVELQRAGEAGWRIEHIDASGSPQATLSEALHAVASVTSP